MKNRVDYLSDKLVHVRKEIKERQKQYLESRGQTVLSSEPAADAAPRTVEVPAMPAPAPAASRPAPEAPEAPESSARLRQDAGARRYEQTLQLRNDLEQRMIRCEARLRHKLEIAEQSAAILSGQSEMLAKSRAELERLALPAPDAVGMVELGDLYRNLDRARLDFFELEAALDAAANAAPSAETAAAAGSAQDTWRAMRFGEAFRLGLALSLPLVLGLGLVILASALLLFFSWR